MNDFQSMVFTRDSYKNDEEMWKDISDFLRILTKNEYIIKFYCEELGMGIYCVEYDSEPGLSAKELRWEDAE